MTILSGTSLACVVPSSSRRIVYYQDAQGGICEAVNSGEWKQSDSALFSAKPLSPLAAVAWADGSEVIYKSQPYKLNLTRQVRIYSLSEQNLLQEWCYSSRNGWYLGELNKLKIQPAANSSVAATQWEDNGTTQIRVYYQETTSDAVQELCFDVHWRRGLVMPTAMPGCSLAVSNWWDNGIHLRVYYQSPDLALREHCYDGHWQVGNYSPGLVPKGSIINALAWFKSTKQLEVFWQDSHQNFVGQKYSVAAGCWQDMGTVVGSLSPGARTTTLHWNSGEDLRVYYQAENNDIFELFLRKDSVSISVVDTVAKSS